MMASDSAPGGETPPTSADTVELAATNQRTHAWWIITAGLGVELPRRLIPLVAAGMFPFDAACEVLQACDLLPLTRLWHAELQVRVTRRVAATGPRAAVDTFRAMVEIAVLDTFGPDSNVDLGEPTSVATRGHSPADHDVAAQVTVSIRVRADSERSARAQAAVAGEHLATVFTGTGISVEHHVSRHLCPDPDSPVGLNASTRIRHEPPASGSFPGDDADLAAARAAQERHSAAYQRRAARVRTALLSVLLQGGIDSLPGAHGPFAMIDDLLRILKLPGLPRAHLYEITAAITLTVPAASPTEARVAAYHLLRDASASTPQYGLPVAVAETFREPDITGESAGNYRVTWYATYLICLRGTPSRRLAEAAVRIQLSVLDGDVPGISDASLHSAYLGEHVDHCLDPYHD